MGLFDEVENLVQQGEEYAKAHPDQVKGGLGKAEEFLNQQTGGQYDSQIQSLGNQAENFLNNQQ